MSPRKRKANEEEEDIGTDDEIEETHGSPQKRKLSSKNYIEDEEDDDGTLRNNFVQIVNSR